MPGALSKQLPNGRAAADLNSADRELFVEVIQIVSDQVEQGGWQSLQNLIIALKLIKLRHPWLKSAWETSDNAPNYTALLYQLSMRAMQEVTGIKVAGSHNNEPGWGKNICDTLGAVAARAAKGEALIAAIVDAVSLCEALDNTAPPGHLSRIAEGPEQPASFKVSGTLNLGSRTVYDRIFEEGGMRFWQFQDIGPGLFVAEAKLEAALAASSLQKEEGRWKSRTSGTAVRGGERAKTELSVDERREVQNLKLEKKQVHDARGTGSPRALLALPALALWGAHANLAQPVKVRAPEVGRKLQHQLRRVFLGEIREAVLELLRGGRGILPGTLPLPVLVLEDWRVCTPEAAVQSGCGCALVVRAGACANFVAPRLSARGCRGGGRRR